ncbi:alpha-D-xyloside xylohydrolase [Catalinimonas alkaloidigena]|uniref:Alpha-D-xyloside xylohydrolase n=1 Tax=Catalinimonas alkaloidigena TaxID=1075417 RepID=A0A1G9AM58_9BACT|nr:TIM-barrel domain-containing protein [Catalinimonas alkaloidigena]SDK28422.1 alpha-D-xyloside xylohydrolase [Catalinimonas alkaloidigena]
MIGKLRRRPTAAAFLLYPSLLRATWTLSLLLLLFPFSSYAQVEKQSDGILLRLPSSKGNSARTLRLQWITDRIVRVTASPAATLPDPASLMVVAQTQATPDWTLDEQRQQVVLRTAALQASVNKATGEVTFRDAQGKVLLQEGGEGRQFRPVTLEGNTLYQLRQDFRTTPDEAFYGLGQPQTNLMNYQGKTVDLVQTNSQVAVPFLVSSKKYGLLWDNYSITRFGDPRPYRPLSDLRLYDKNGKAGGLTATYASKDQPDKVYTQRTEQEIDYEFLDCLDRLPKEFPMQEGLVTWEGEIAANTTGEHLFLMTVAGYVKVWINNEELVDRWREAWNPGPELFAFAMEQGKKYPLRITWDPDGGQSFLSMKWLPPRPASAQHQFSLVSEAGEQLDYYFVAGDNLDEVISGYRHLTGKAQIMPRWAMGFWQSRERYKTQEEVLSTVQEFRKRRIPLDNIVQDWSYWKEDQWGSQEFDATRFPDPKGMIAQLHGQYHTHFMISVWPKFYEGIENYRKFDEKGWLYTQNIKNRQRDWIGQGYVSTFYDAFNPEARQLFWELLSEKLFSKGVDAWWMDASEPDILSNASIEHRKSLMNPTALGSATQYFNAYPLVNAQGIYEGQRAERPNQRVFTLTRSAYAGIQRYGAATWSGDIASRFDEMARQIPGGLNFALSGLPYWTTDIGGFFVENKYDRPAPQGEALEEWRELNTRWYQFGAFCPLFRVHGQFPYREIYNIAPESHPAYQSMLYYNRLRYRLMPYLYSLTGQVYHQDYTLMRALVMDFTADPNVYNIGDQFMFGPSLLVSPVTTYKARERTLYLPAATGWYDAYTGKHQRGGQSITAEAPLERMPLFVKEGSIVPFGPDLQYTSEKPADPITLYVYTGQDAAFTLYEDEDTTYAYEQGAYATIPLEYKESTGTLTIGSRQGEFPGMLRERTFRVVWVTPNRPKGWEDNPAVDHTLTYRGTTQTLKRP